MSESEDSDYIVEHYIQPKTCSVPLRNDEGADLLGNFDDSKRKNNGIGDDNNSNGGTSDGEDRSENEDYENGDIESGSETDNRKQETESIGSRKLKVKKPSKEYDGKISQEQIAALLRGSTKSNRFVVYVTNLNFGTSKERLTEYFSTAGNVKAVRIPKNRKGGFAFVEMCDVDGFKNAFSLHNTILDERPIKIQLSEAGKKKSANKKNILKQKNRKLAEMRNETKTFSKSGKNYDKSIKKEIAKEKLQQTKLWERRKARREKKKNIQK
ncbi:putative RNA-binding protein [Pseudolycoriella hygida]|uniref:RNA-binding protein n=1 Tax=Pseudolycoriella hygida TaxID=35572 RepID=A0A9Q0RTD9_9DIPT|nr:putative RNA-binding protein [Pseudolycoriella hygida]